MHRELLAPFYIETVTDLPTYMTLVQYADCRWVENVGLSLFIQEFITV